MDNQVRKDTRDRREAPVCPDDQAMKDQLAKRATRETQDSMVHQDPLDPLDTKDLRDPRERRVKPVCPALAFLEPRETKEFLGESL